MPCLCPQCSQKPDFLFTEDWRRATEAAEVLKRFTKEQRLEYYRVVWKRRGEAAARQLIKDVEREYAEAHHE